MTKRKTQEEFLNDCEKVHGVKYDYSETEYIKSNEKVCIICHNKDENGIEHGIFWMTPNAHLSGHGCKKCHILKIKEKTKKGETGFLKKCELLHGNKYDYKNVDFINYETKVCIICHEKDEFGNEHGEFWQKPSDHTKKKKPCGCPKCAKNTMFTNKQFILKCIKEHGNKYDYINTKYYGIDNKVSVICHRKDENGVEHGLFRQTAYHHLNGHGCPKCANENTKRVLTQSKKEFLVNSLKAHGKKYDYSKSEYKNSKVRLCVICPEHGEFWVTPNDHINKKSGCPVCKESKIEKKVRILLNDRNIDYFYVKTFDWLKYKKKLTLDFYLPEYNIAIECQGEQHFKPHLYFGGDDNFKLIQHRDKIKKQLCEEHNLPLFYINYDHNIEEKLIEILENKELF